MQQRREHSTWWGSVPQGAVHAHTTLHAGTGWHWLLQVPRCLSVCICDCESECRKLVDRLQPYACVSSSDGWAGVTIHRCQAAEVQQQCAATMSSRANTAQRQPGSAWKSKSTQQPTHQQSTRQHPMRPQVFDNTGALTRISHTCLHAHTLACLLACALLQAPQDCSHGLVLLTCEGYR